MFEEVSTIVVLLVFGAIGWWLYRANAAWKRKHLEEFIAKNKARASTATRAKSKEKQLEKLEFEEIAAEGPVARIRAPRVEPRQAAALRCQGLSIGYPERTIATGIDLEIEHGSRAAIVGEKSSGGSTIPSASTG